MRVITGTARGRKLFAPAGEDTRPTSALVKESVFNIIQFDIEGRQMLDLFAGTGQMGIEALSRGAAEAVFVENSRPAAEVIKKNLAICGFEKNSRVLLRDAEAFLHPGCGVFDLIFIDPPYASDLYEKALSAICAFDILSEGGIIICESDAGRQLPELKEPYFKGRSYRYGKRMITIFGRRATALPPDEK